MTSELHFEFSPLNQRQTDPTWQFSRGRIEFIHGWLVTASAGDSVRGYGHVLTTPIGAPDIPTTQTALQQAVLALNSIRLFEIEKMHRVLHEACPNAPTVRSGLVGAALDLVATHLGVPLHVLFGGAVTQVLPVARLVPIKEPESMAEEARQLAGQGYRIIKLKLSGAFDADVRRVRASRQAVGAGVLLTVDANQAYGCDAALELCKALAASNVSLLEQPLPAQDWEGMARITAAALIPIEADESVAGSFQNLIELIKMKAADSYNLKVPYFGGLRATWLAAKACEEAGVTARLGAIFGPCLASAQAAHLASVLPVPHLGVELAESEHILDDPFEGFNIRNGVVNVPQRPGSGVAPVRVTC